jgi:hypothetical protein
MKSRAVNLAKITPIVLFPEPGIPIKTILVGFLSMAAHIGILNSCRLKPFQTSRRLDKIRSISPKYVPFKLNSYRPDGIF